VQNLIKTAPQKMFLGEHSQYL